MVGVFIYRELKRLLFLYPFFGGGEISWQAEYRVLQ